VAANEPATEAATPGSPNAIAQQQAEALGTEQMLIAHAPLRTPEIANPDSDQNRRVLHQMVGKALVRAASSGASRATIP
jgi:hypothetical protein